MILFVCINILLNDFYIEFIAAKLIDFPSDDEEQEQDEQDHEDFEEVTLT